MNQFTEIRIDGFRRLCGIELPLKPLNVVIGANGVGKTSLLDVFDVLRAAADGGLAEKVDHLQGFPSIVTRDGRSEVSIKSSLQSPDMPSAIHHMQLYGAGIGYKVAYENLSSLPLPPDEPFCIFEREGDTLNYYLGEPDVGFQKSERSLKAAESCLSQLPMRFPKAMDVVEFYSGIMKFGPISVAVQAPVRLPQSLRPAQNPGRNGENLAACLYSMRESEPDRFEAVEDTLRAAFPGFRKLGFPSVAAGMVSITWQDTNFGEPFYPHELSEGTLRFLWLVTLLQSPGLPAVTLIDEPEISLHPELLNLLAELFREASTRTQLIVATQSDSLIRFLKPEEVVVMDIGEDGLATATRADTMDLDNWLKDYTLDEVWRMGRMGGRA